VAVILILVVPYFIVKKQKEDKKISNPVIESTVSLLLPLEKDKNVTRIENLNQVYAGEEKIEEVINLNQKIFALGASQITDLTEGKKYSPPADFGQIKTACGMDDLNLIFILNDRNSVLSWSPISKKFQENQIIIPEKASIISSGTFLTYFYLLDQTNNQIYRYPRAEGGFGTSVNWLKETISLSSVKDLAVSDNIYLAENGKIIKLYRGKKQDFRIEETTTAIVADKIYTQEDYQYIYILDKTNSRIVKLDLNGNIVSQYYNAEISSAENFTIDEEASTIYLSFGGNIKSFKME
jgi:hypothetical protein